MSFPGEEATKNAVQSGEVRSMAVPDLPGPEAEASILRARDEMTQCADQTSVDRPFVRF